MQVSRLNVKLLVLLLTLFSITATAQPRTIQTNPTITT